MPSCRGRRRGRFRPPRRSADHEPAPTIRDPRASALEARLERARSAWRPLIDLAESDPARCGLAPDPRELADLEPAGSSEAREAVALYLASHGAAIAPERAVLTASAVEACEMLLSVLCDPGDELLVPSIHSTSD